MNLARRQCLRAGASMVLAPGVLQAEAARPGDLIEWPVIWLLDGNPWSAASWRGRPAVVVFWATWCAHCERHNAHVDRLHRTLAGRQLRIVGAAIDGDAAALRRYMDRHGYTFPVTLDAQALRSRLTTRRSVPLTCVIDADGRLKQIIPGEMSEADVLQLAALAAPGRT
jgi:thiol-disulfide isomerase/thioredoxin